MTAKKTKSTKQVLQSISRSFSPAKQDLSSCSTQIPSLASSALPPTPPQSPQNLLPSTGSVDDFVDVNLSDFEKRSINQIDSSVNQNDQVQLLAPSAMLSDTEPWKNLFKSSKHHLQRLDASSSPSLNHHLNSFQPSTCTPPNSSISSSHSLIHQASMNPSPNSPLRLHTPPESSLSCPSTLSTSSPHPSSSLSANPPPPSQDNLTATSPSNSSLEVIDHLSLEFAPTLPLPPFTASSSTSTPSPMDDDRSSSIPHSDPPALSSASSIASSSATTTRPPLTPCEPADLPVDNVSSISQQALPSSPSFGAVTPPLPVDSPLSTCISPIMSQSKTGLNDFEIIRVLGKGCAGKVLMVKYHPVNTTNPSKNERVYAMKSIRKNHVLAHRELQHTLTEQRVLKRVANEPGSNPFIVRLWWSFHDKEHLFLVMDFHPGGDLATQLARWGRLGRDRARFYAAEITEGVTSLHRSGVVYRDLKPENILIAFDGHIVLTDFGLSKQFVASEEDDGGRSTERTLTFCGTAEYLAPEVLLGEPYSYEVDWWSFGTMLYEMLTGLTPFWSEDHATMYRRVLHDELTFNEDSSRVMDHDTRTLLRGLLQRNPAVRMTGTRIKKHPYFGMIDWDHVRHKRYIPPYVPAVNPNDATDTQNFDETFLAMEPTHIQEEDAAQKAAGGATPGDPEAEGEGEAGDVMNDDEETDSPGKVEPEKATDENGNDVFDGYSFLAPRDERDSIFEEEMDVEEHAETATDDQAKSAERASEVDGSANTTLVLDDVYSTKSDTRATSVERETATSVEQSAAVDAKRKPTFRKAELRKAESNGLDSMTVDSKIDDDIFDEDWDVVDVPEGGVSDCNGRRGKKANNTLFARGVVDKYKLRMKKFNEPTTANPSSTSARANSISQNSTTSMNHLTSDSSDNGLGSSSTANVPPTSQPKPRRRFGLMSKSSDRQRTLSPTRAGVEVEQLGRVGASRLIRSNLFKGRSMSSNSNTPEGLLDRLPRENVGSSSTFAVSKKRLNLNAFLSSHHLGGSKHAGQQSNEARSGLSRSTSANKVSQQQQSAGSAQTPRSGRIAKARRP